MKTIYPKTINPLLPGEKPIPKAPLLVLDDGTNCIPQHYLSYHHTLDSLSEIMSHIDFDPQYVLFADKENNNLFIQVGIIGKDNYLPKSKQHADKIVYGRRWRVEPQLPSSEIIQTAFLALSKAREHEIRELFKYSIMAKKHDSKSDSVPQNEKIALTTPFSCHHDLPLIAMSKATDTSAEKQNMSIEEIKQCFKKILYDNARLGFEGLQTLSGGTINQYILSFSIQPQAHTSLPELADPIFAHILVNDLHEDTILYGLLDYLLALSNRYVEEHFRFKGYARFSRSQSIAKISKLSAETRIRTQSVMDNEFAMTFANINYETDATRVPKVNAGPLGDKIKAQLEQFNIGYGILPK